MENKFTKVRSIKDIVICTIILVAGLLMVTITDAEALNIAGFFTIFAALLLFVLMKSGYKEIETGARYCKTERYFSNEMREVLKRSMESPARICADNEDKGSSLRFDVFHSKDLNKVFCQLYEYIPYKYEPCSKIYEHSYEEGSKLIEK